MKGPDNSTCHLFPESTTSETNVGGWRGMFRVTDNMVFDNVVCVARVRFLRDNVL